MAKRFSLVFLMAYLFLGNAWALSRFFEVLKPIPKPAGARRCSFPVMNNRSFTATAPFTASFSPPLRCGKVWSLVTLSVLANFTSSSTHNSRVNVFIDGINVAKMSFQLLQTADLYYGPDPEDIVGDWSFETDITKYAAFLQQKRKISIALDNPFPGDLRMSFTLNYYAGNISSPAFADVIVPLSSKFSPNTPFNLTYSSRKRQVSLSGLPRNIYRAEVEIFQLQSGTDSSYWDNYSDRSLKFLTPGERAYYTGGGPFKGTFVYVDGLLAGATWQHPRLVYTSVVAWQPVLPIGGQVNPSYRIDITPFIGLLVDGKSHNITLAIANISSGGFWEVSGALHLWLDKKAKQTHGRLITRQISDSLAPSETFDPDLEFHLANATYRASKTSKVVGSVSTSFGNFIATSSSNLRLSNDISWTIDEETYTSVYQSAVLHKLAGTNRVEMKFSNGNRLFYRSEDFSFLLKQSTFHSGYASSEEFEQGVITNTTTQYGNGKLRTETLSNTQSARNSLFFFSRDVGEYSQRYSYRSNFNGCYFRKVLRGRGTDNLDKGRSTC